MGKTMTLIRENVQGYVIAFDMFTGKFAVVDTVTNPEKYRVKERFATQEEAKEYARHIAYREVIRNKTSVRM